MKRLRKLCALTLTVSLLALSGCSASAYRDAKHMLDSGDYDAAATAFEELGDYKDSNDLARLSRYRAGCAAYEEGNFTRAEEYFIEDPDYKDSGEYLRNCRDRELGTKISGRWITETADLTEKLIAAVSGPEDAAAAEILQYLSSDGFQIAYVVHIEENGKYTLEIDENSYNSAIDRIIDELIPGITEYFIEAYSETLAYSGLTLEDVYTELDLDGFEELFYVSEGMTLRDAVNGVLPRDSLLAVIRNMSHTGTWQISGEVICFSAGAKSMTATYDSETDTLSFSGEELNGLEASRAED